MDFMEIDDNPYINKTLKMDGLVTEDEIIGRLLSAEPTQATNNIQGDLLQSRYDTLAAERTQLEDRLTNVTKEKDQLQQTYNSLTTERDQFKASFNNLKNASDQLQTSYNTLKQQSDQLRTNNNNLAASENQLQTKFGTLQREKAQLQTSFVALTTIRDQLQSNYSSLKMNMDRLQSSYNALSVIKNNLQVSYSLLRRNKDQLQSSYNTLQREKQQLQTDLASTRDQLEKMTTRRNCQSGWRKFHVNCYFISEEKKSWSSSRQDCIAKGADLVIINSREEQEFVRGLLRTDEDAWIGLTDSLKEGTWTWVDGTPVTTAFWQQNQPNNYKGNQDCGEAVHKSSGQWNDMICSYEQMFICEL
ncbi:C-type lectin domain family 4 member M-like isoform X2 [Plectropomus leopardus]|uniref:C-type lectin domain family 4 member M-like isoform X2 n=1 Tax=Plectropomus leopardus TaxID=160734 RepID=UPI001C4B8DCE|nr:C-type lectin domain family 4 member M-like isoform X2 [Plectropomus leopardus]